MSFDHARLRSTVAGFTANLAPGLLIVASLTILGFAAFELEGLTLAAFLGGSLPTLGAAGAGLSAHRFGEIDPIDAAISPAFVLASVVAVGIGSFEVFGYSFGSSVYSTSGGEITIATVVSIGAIVIAYATNQVNASDFDQVETLVVVGTVLSTIALAIVPMYSDLVMGSQLIGAFVVVIHSAGYALLAYY